MKPQVKSPQFGKLLIKMYEKQFQTFQSVFSCTDDAVSPRASNSFPQRVMDTDGQSECTSVSAITPLKKTPSALMKSPQMKRKRFVVMTVSEKVSSTGRLITP